MFVFIVALVCLFFTLMVNAQCIPENGIDVDRCSARITNCARSGILMKWNPGGCRDNDSGCQCNDYCGYRCPISCNKDSQCRWRGDGCYNIALNTKGFPMPICNATISPTTHSPTIPPSTLPTKSPTTPGATLTPTTSPINVLPTTSPSRSPTKLPTTKPSKSPTVLTRCSRTGPVFFRASRAVFNYVNAQRYCQLFGGQLARIFNSIENLAVFAACGAKAHGRPCWLGGSTRNQDLNNFWYWNEMTAPFYQVDTHNDFGCFTSWGIFAPSGRLSRDGLRTVGILPFWRDDQERDRNHAVCEFPI